MRQNKYNSQQHQNSIYGDIAPTSFRPKPLVRQVLSSIFRVWIGHFSHLMRSWICRNFVVELRPVSTSTSIAIGPTSILSALVHVFDCNRFDCNRFDCNRANPPLVGELDLDQKWIITGNEAIMWPAHSLIKAHVCCMYGEKQTVSKASWMRYPETRLCKGEWQVGYHVRTIGPCLRVITS